MKRAGCGPEIVNGRQLTADMEQNCKLFVLTKTEKGRRRIENKLREKPLWPVRRRQD
jgi:hypothetical protein